MKNLTNFYAIIFAPLLTCILLLKLELITTSIFSFSIIFYGIIINPLFQYYRAKELGLVEQKEVFKFLIPFWSLRFFSQLFLTK
jgi:hypothetical protein